MPRSSQKRRTASIACWTSGVSKVRSGRWEEKPCEKYAPAGSSHVHLEDSVPGTMSRPEPQTPALWASSTARMWSSKRAPGLSHCGWASTPWPGSLRLPAATSPGLVAEDVGLPAGRVQPHVVRADAPVVVIAGEEV